MKATDRKETTLQEAKGYILSAFDSCIENLNDERKAEGLQYARLYFGEDTKEDSPAALLMTGFLMGFNEGMRAMELMNDETQPE